MALIMKDNFFGTTIDTSKWVETDTDGLISQNGRLIFSNPHNATRSSNLTSVSTSSAAILVAQMNLDWTDPGSNEASVAMTLKRDSNNSCAIGCRSSGGTYRLLITIGGVNVYSLETSIAKVKDVKIVDDGSTIKFFYWSGTAWTQMGTTYNGTIGRSNNVVVLSNYDASGFVNCDIAYIDNFFFSDADYQTQYPAILNPRFRPLSQTRFINDANLTAYYPLDGNSTDLKNGYNGIDNNITYGTEYGLFGKQGAYFGGVDSRINLGDRSAWDFGTGAFSIGTIIKTNYVGEYQAIFAIQDDNNSHYPYILFYVEKTSGHLVAYIRGVSLTPTAEASSNINVADGLPHYVEMVSTGSGGTLSVYVDGVLGASVAVGSIDLTFSQAKAFIGCVCQEWLPSYTYHFKGSMCDYHIMKGKGLTASEVSELYQSMTYGEVIKDANTKLLCQFNGNSSDASGNNIVLTETGITYDEDGAIFDGLTSKMVSAHSSVFDVGTGDFTVCFVGKIASKSATLFAKDLADSGNGIMIFTDASTGVMRVWCAGQVKNGTIALDDSALHHIVLTRIGGTTYQYVDGKLDVSATNQNGSVNVANDVICIGLANGIYANMKAKRLWFEAGGWTAQQVAKDYSHFKGRLAII